MNKNPVRLAWIVTLVSFFVCVGLVIGVPLGLRAYLVSAQQRHNVIVKVQWGTLYVTQAGRGEPIIIAEQRDDIPERTVVTTNQAKGRIEVFTFWAGEPLIASVQLYEHTQVVLASSSSPRFSISDLPHRTALEIKSGHVSISVSDTDDRPTLFEVHTPQGATVLTEGNYEVDVDAATTEIAVHHGRAKVQAGELVQSLETDDYADVRNGQIHGPMPAMHLIANGDFRSQLDGWTVFGEQSDVEQPSGTVTVVLDGERHVTSFYRDGSGHAAVGIEQEINYDIRDLTSVKLHLVTRVISEDILGFGGCGSEGYECPLIVLLNYEDAEGVEGEWLHGFYIGEPDGTWPIYGWAERVKPNEWYIFDSGNLVEQLDYADPVLLKSLRIYASGHSFHAMVTEIKLLARE